MKVAVKASAKINLLLDIVGKRDDGYHLVQMIMQSVDLQDIVTVTLTDAPGEVKVSCPGNDEIPLDERNTAYQAARLFFQGTGLENPGVSIKIKKRIPVSAGMAGGSADAAAVLAGLNYLFHNIADEEQLSDIGEKVGADVPFCLHGGTMLAEGIGTILSPLPDMPPCFIVLAKPDVAVSTAQAYHKFDSLQEVVHPDFEDMSDAVCLQSLDEVGRYAANVFEQSIDIPEIGKLKEVMLAFGAVGACMSGSGPTVFGLFENRDDAQRCCTQLRDAVPFAVVCEPCSHGWEIDG